MKKYCQNCYYPLPYKAKFCAHCGQKVSDGKVTVGDVLQQLWFRILHLESRSWRVLWRLFVPGQVSIDYFKGKRKRYPPPVQFFFVIMFFFLLIVNHLVGDKGGVSFRQRDDKIHVSSNDTIAPRTDLYRLGVSYVQMQKMRAAFDSLPESVRTPEARAALDSVLLRTNHQTKQRLARIFDPQQSTSANAPPDSITVSLGFRQQRIALADAFEGNVENLIEQYHLTHWLDKVLMRQGVRSVRDPNALIKTYLGSLAWTAMVLIALMAGVLTLLYRRRGRYYVEHFIFLLHQHTAIFLTLTVLLLLQQLIALPLTFWILLFFWILLSMLIAMRRYYGQGWGKTFLKWVIFYVFYLGGFIVLFTLGILFAFFVF